MDVLHDEIRELVRDSTMFREVQAIVRDNPRIQWPTVYSRYIGKIYRSYALAGLDRQYRPQENGVSFVGLLDEIAEAPQELSLKYYCSLLPDATPQQLTLYKADFQQHADFSGAHVCPHRVKDDLDKLKKTANTYEYFAEQHAARQDHPDPKGRPTFDALDRCIQLLHRTYVKYHLLFYAEKLDTLTPARQFGSAKGLIVIGEDFDDELSDFKEYME